MRHQLPEDPSRFSATGSGADGDEHVCPEGSRLPPGERMPVRRLGAELLHPAEDGDGTPAVPPRGERLEPSPHRERVRVVGVVDQQAATRQSPILAAPGRELDGLGAVSDPVERQAERRVDGGRGGEAEAMVREADKRATEPQGSGSDIDWNAIHPDDPIEPSRFATWVFMVEDKGARIKR